jgi:hypothetical protein
MVWGKYVEVRNVGIFGMCGDCWDLSGSKAQVNTFLVLRTVVFWENGKIDITGIKIVHEPCAARSWHKLEMRIRSLSQK